jgi:hypothetical protein
MTSPKSRSTFSGTGLLQKFLAAWFLFSSMLGSPASAGEGGGSHYMPGTAGDFAMALIGPPGFYIRNDVMYFMGDINSVTLGNRIVSPASQDVWVNTLKAIWLAKGGPFEGRFGFVVSVPYVINAKVSGDLLSPINTHQSGSRSGFGDIAITSFLNWLSAENHVSLGVTVYLPTGYYEEGSIINLGRNYWSIDPSVTITWLVPKRGHEISFITGIMFNTTNDATNYASGHEWHMDFMLAQHFSADFAVGVVGSFLQGLGDDSGPLLKKANALLPLFGKQPLGGFRAKYFGLGPAVYYSPTIAGKDVNLIAKYLFDITHENRFDSDYFMFSIAMAL